MTNKSDSDEGTFGIDAADLILALQGKVYEDYACNSVHGVISRGAMTGIQFVVRRRILELTIELERAVPEAVAIEFGNSAAAERSHSAKVSQISNQIIYGDVTNISSTGHGAHFAVAIYKGNPESLASSLLGAGLPKEDAEEFSAIVASEDPGTPEEPMGERAKAWLLANLRKATDGTWKVGVSVATKVLTEAVLKYYGLK